MLSGTYTQTQIAARFGIDPIPETEMSTYARLVWLNSENSLHTAWAGYSAGSGNPQRLPLVRESGSHACYSPQFSHSQFGSQYFGLPRGSPADSPDRNTLPCAPKFFVRTVVVGSHHNSRPFITKGVLKV
jgi:hypothetical protein